MKSKFRYDKGNDILAIHKGFSSDEKFEGNADLGQVVLDISNKGSIRGIEIMDASDFLKEFNVGKDALETMTEAEFDAEIKPNVIMLSITVKVDRHVRLAKIAVPITLKREAGVLFA